MPVRPENKARYPPDWPEVSRARKEHAGWRCECTGWCGSPAAGHLADDGRCSNRHGEPAYLTGAAVVLTGAHLDHQPENNDSVRALCQRCHLAYDREHHAQTRRATRAAAASREAAPL